MSYSAFFYGTLMHPSILRRVIGHPGADLQLCPAILLDYTRHKIHHADYPAVIPYTQSRNLFMSAGIPEPSLEDRTVRGTFVTGLNDQDISLLDLFEGNEYTREAVHVHPLAEDPSTDAYVVPPTTAPLPARSALAPAVRAETYVYAGPAARDLSPELWSYDAFVRENAWKWVGRGADRENYAEVDHRREMGGRTLRTAIVAEDGELGVEVTDV
ncbi:uncharacterized protein BXZ73DRAFT_96388 [Epithele typhae]|uniref:uncharacterized protein n=1 Tax=Epithele typhae TaxID=378194 RepID=UPI002007F8BC|nr:uncharacterized protein BXZ73DRAFT_96388 [Epithele typhae]KAH9945397.1 hypothetical protein BXZ73DRAFT_96388 [Epithele typhae]